MNEISVREMSVRLSQLGLVTVFWKEYQITHSQLTLEVWEGRPVVASLYLLGCDYLSGPPHNYDCTVGLATDVTDPSMLRLFTKSDREQRLTSVICQQLTIMYPDDTSFLVGNMTG